MSHQATLSNNLEEKCQEFAQMLGLDEPVQPAVLVAALEDNTYAHNLITCRNHPAFLDRLLANPPQVSQPVVVATQVEHSNTALVGKAAQALLRWGKAGFSIVDDETLERRESACLACPNLIEPKKRLQKLMSSKSVSNTVGKRTGDKACNLCGCNAGKKMRLPSEACPAQHPTKAGLTRWGEPIELEN